MQVKLLLFGLVIVAEVLFLAVSDACICMQVRRRIFGGHSTSRMVSVGVARLRLGRRLLGTVTM